MDSNHYYLDINMMHILYSVYIYIHTFEAWIIFMMDDRIMDTSLERVSKPIAGCILC